MSTSAQHARGGWFRVAGRDDLSDGDMKQAKAGDADILLARVDGQYRAIGAFCSHYMGRRWPTARSAATGLFVPGITPAFG